MMMAPASRSRAQRQLRLRAVVHAGEVNYDANGCFGEALDIAFRLLDAAHVKKALQAAADPLILVISGDIYRAIVRHGYDGIDQRARRQIRRQSRRRELPQQLPTVSSAIATTSPATSRRLAFMVQRIVNENPGSAMATPMIAHTVRQTSNWAARTEDSSP